MIRIYIVHFQLQIDCRFSFITNWVHKYLQRFSPVKRISKSFDWKMVEEKRPMTITPNHTEYYPKLIEFSHSQCTMYMLIIRVYARIQIYQLILMKLHWTKAIFNAIILQWHKFYWLCIQHGNNRPIQISIANKYSDRKQL